jgi:uncharacterized protein YdeI (YjbR/CyaY-like superfamily)
VPAPLPAEHKGRPVVPARTRAAWRRWLEKNHASGSAVWVPCRKQGSAAPALTYDQVVEEALCFGWIDSTVNRLDPDRFLILIAPRKPKSVWAASNKRRVEALIAAGRMAPPGLEKIKAAQADGSWNALDAVDALEMPPDLRQALSRHPAARANFEGFSPSARKMILFWISTARRPETRARRIAETALLAAQNKPSR